MLTLLLDLLGLALFLVSIPLVLELLILSLAALLPANAAPNSAPSTFRLHVIIPAHNEQSLIAACVRSVLASRQPGAEVFVVAHNCTDQTAAQAAQAGAHVLTLNDTVGGKGTALDQAFIHALAQGAEAVLVIDADSTVSPNLLPAVAAALSRGADAVQTRYLVANPSATTRTRLMSLAFLGMNLLRPRGRDRLGLSCGIFGNGFALSAATLRRVPYVANSVVEDLEYHLLLIRAGLRVRFLDHATVLGEMPESNAASSTQRARWEGGRILMRRQWTGPLLREVFGGHPRMLEPLLDLISLPLATVAGLLLVSLLPPLLWLRVYAVFGLLTLVLYVLVAASLGPDPGKTLQALARAPGYMLWKLALLPKTRLAARHNSAWVRTARNQAPPVADPPSPSV